MTNYYYLIKSESLNYDRVENSLISLDINNNPTREEVILFKERMRVVIDTLNGNQKYTIVKMGLDFDNSFEGLIACSKLEIKTLLANMKWLHKIEEFRLNKTMVLNGNNTHGIFSNNDLGVYDGFTFSLWVKIRAVAQHSLFYKWDSPSNQRTFGFDINTGGYPSMYTCENGISAEYKGAAGGKLTIDEWSHLAFTFTSGKVDIILNGVSILSNTTSVNTTLKQTTQPIYFGAFNSGGITQVPNAEIQEVLVYNKALTVSQCLDIKNLNRAGDIIALDSYVDLVSWYAFSEFDGTTVIDIKGSNDITMYNTTVDDVI